MSFFKINAHTSSMSVNKIVTKTNKKVPNQPNSLIIIH